MSHTLFIITENNQEVNHYYIGTTTKDPTKIFERYKLIANSCSTKPSHQCCPCFELIKNDKSVALEVVATGTRSECLVRRRLLERLKKGCINKEIRSH